MATISVHGGCHCGKIAFEAAVDPNTVSICHCTDCQNLTGSPFRTTIQAPADTLKMLRGTPKIYLKTTAESGTHRAHAFCPDCGTPLWAAAPQNPTQYGLRVGTLQERAQLRPHRESWVRSALPWVADLDGLGLEKREKG